MAHRKKIPNPRTITAEQCRDGLAACKLRQANLRHLAPSLRTQHTGELLVTAQREGNTTKERAIKERMQIERSKKLWKRIKKATRPATGRACLQVQVKTDDSTLSYSSKQDIEQAIQTECNERFHLGDSAPIAETMLGQDLRYLQNIDLAYSILNGSYSIPPHLDEATKLILMEIGKLRSKVLNIRDPYTITFTGEDFITYWNRLNENPSSSPSGLHIAHYKASAKAVDHAEIFAAQMNLIIETGIHPLQWGVALQVMLEKMAGVCLVDKLRSIQLYEADLNWFMKFVFNDLALSRLHETGLLPEEHYSHKGSTAEDACLEKSLTLDISRQSRSPMALISVDAAQCYDRVHPVLMSLVWLALTSSPHAVIILLRVLQEMKIFTRTGFGDSDTFFGGDPDNPLCGLGQGSKAAPASWLQLSSMIVNAYKTQGCTSLVIDPITGNPTKSVGCLFVDDTDLYTIHPLLKFTMAVIASAQICVDTWSSLLAATGGSIKGQKSFWYLIAYTCVNGIWQYMPNTHQSTYRLRLKNIDGSSTILTRKSVDEAEKTLGVYHSPDGSHKARLQYLSDKALKWVNQMKNAHLPSALVMMSYKFQLWPALRYGLGTLTNSLSLAETCLSKLDFQLLPLIGVNRHITTGWRRLHYSFGGIGLLSLPTEQLICRLNMLLHHYKTNSIIGNKLTCSLHWLQLHIGCMGNPLLEDFNRWGHLAPVSWVSRLWESLSNTKSLTLFMKYNDIPPPRILDRTIMEFLQEHLTTALHTQQINRCKCYLRLLFLSDITLADGKTIDPYMISMNPTPKTSSYSFPPELPTKADWAEWTFIWRKVCGRTHSLPFILGAWINKSHIKWTWMYDTVHNIITEHTESGCRQYTLITSSHITRRCKYFAETTILLPTTTGIPASCTRVRNTKQPHRHQIALTCLGPQRHIPQKLPTSFWDDLLALGGEWMWNSLSFDTNNSLDWLLRAYANSSLLWVTDGSYNSKTAPDVSRTGWIVCDSMTSRRWTRTFWETSVSATSYRAELLGIYSIHIFLSTLVRHFNLLSTHQAKIRCDNKNALRSSSRKNQRIRATSKCADILRAFRTLHRDGHLNIHYGHVPAHLDDVLSWDELTLEQQLNVQCDYLAKRAVERSVQLYNNRICDERTPQLLPGERCAIMVNGSKVTSDLAPDVRYSTSLSQARHFLITKRGWTERQFDSVDWTHLHRCLKVKSVGFRIWLSKQHSDFCATRVQMKWWYGATDDRCPSCEIRSEKASHLCRCPNEERTLLLHDNTRKLEEWMALSGNTYHELLYLIPKYILCRGTVKFCDLGPMSPRMMQLAQSQDEIGWRNFMEGRVSTHIFHIQHAHLLSSPSVLHAGSWMKQFLSRLLHITHSQWLFRNFMLHDSSAGYLKLKERATLTVQIDSLMSAQQTSIPDECRFLLESDVDTLLRSDTDTQHYWIAAMEAALAAKSPARPSSNHPMQQQRPQRPWHSRWTTSNVIRQLRLDARSRLIPSNWIWTDTALTRPVTSSYSRPVHERTQLGYKSNKKHKPD